MVSFGEGIRFYRLEKEMSQAALGNIVGLTSQAIDNYERNMRMPTANTLANIASALA
ncbi:MAG: helix-turn-helix domain-containing protein [Defluviitaleaceae bacterium]|nr:helix-turn-helix domain-containing protein [Defluviitaleaceae bacterium]